jgi:hypothetical protein
VGVNGGDFYPFLPAADAGTARVSAQFLNARISSERVTESGTVWDIASSNKGVVSWLFWEKAA